MRGGMIEIRAIPAKIETSYKMTTPTVTEIKSSRIEPNYIDMTPTAAELQQLQEWACLTARNSIETAFEDYKNIETFRHGTGGVIALEVKANVSSFDNIHVFAAVGFDDAGELVIEYWNGWNDKSYKARSVDRACECITMAIERELARYSQIWDDEEMNDDMFAQLLGSVFAVIE